MKNLYKTLLMSGLVITSGAFAAQEEVILGMPTGLTDWALMGKSIEVSPDLGDALSFLGDETKEHEALRRSLEADLDFIIEALIKSGLHENMNHLSLTQKIATSRVTFQETLPIRVFLTINPLWFNELSGFDKWTFVAQTIIGAYRSKYNSIDNQQLVPLLRKLSSHTRILTARTPATPLEAEYMHQLSEKDLAHIYSHKKQVYSE